MVTQQMDLIDKWIDSPKSNMLFLDACRFDYFEELYEEYYEGDLTKAFTPTKYTPDWFYLNFNGNYDIAFYNAVPIRAFGTDVIDTRLHFEYVKSWKDIPFDVKKRKQEPKELNSVVMNDNKWNGKCMVRYLLPHGPYYGTSLENYNGKGYRELIRKALKDDEITKDELDNAYKHNLRRALEASIELIKYWKEEGFSTVITSDHGEWLGEDENLLHGRDTPDGKPINHVPWFEVKEIIDE